MPDFRKEEDIVRPHGMGNRGITDKGLMDLAYRSGEISVIQAHTVYENDEFSYEFGLDPKLTHKPAVKERGEPVAFYAMFKTKDGGYGFEVMSVEDVRKHAKKYSKSYGSDYSPWNTSFVEMSKKTVLKDTFPQENRKHSPQEADVPARATHLSSISTKTVKATS